MLIPSSGSSIPLKIFFVVITIVLIITASLLPGIGLVGAAVVNRGPERQSCEETGSCPVPVSLPSAPAPVEGYIPPPAPIESAAPVAVEPVEVRPTEPADEQEREPAFLETPALKTKPIDIILLWVEKIYEEPVAYRTTIAQLKKMLSAVENSDANHTSEQSFRWQALLEVVELLEISNGDLRVIPEEKVVVGMVKDIRENMRTKVVVRDKQFFWTNANNFHGDCSNSSVSIMGGNSGEVQIFFHNFTASNGAGRKASLACDFNVGISGANTNDGAWLNAVADVTSTVPSNAHATFIIGVDGNYDPDPKAGEAVQGRAFYSSTSHFFVPSDANARMSATVSVQPNTAGDPVDAKVSSVTLKITNDSSVVDPPTVTLIFTTAAIIGLFFGL